MLLISKTNSENRFFILKPPSLSLQQIDFWFVPSEKIEFIDTFTIEKEKLT